MLKLFRRVLLAAVLVAQAGCTSFSPKPGFEYRLPDTGMQPPEAASGWTDKPGWHASRWMAAAAHPLAADAAAQILKAGGSAVDGAIAAQMVLTLVEPQSSGIGGGAFLVHWDGRDIEAYDGRETAPTEVDENLFLEEGQPVPFHAGVVGGRAVGVPGLLRMLELAYKRHGRLPWADLFQPAIRLAEAGFPISPRLATLIQGDAYLPEDADARLYFYEAAGRPKQAGTLLRNPPLAEVLRAVAGQGAEAFYTGAIAHDIVLKVQGHPANPGQLTQADLGAYQAKASPALCFDYRHYRLCGPPPPSSGTLALGQILGMLEHTDIAAHRPVRGADGWSLPVEAVHLYSEAARLAFADRAYYAADGEMVEVPVAGLLDPAYLKRRAGLIGPWSMGRAEPGRPTGVAVGHGPGRSPERPSTSHLSVVDGDGNAVAMTASIEDAFGARQMVRGFLLNNQLTDFSFLPTDGTGRLVANRVQPGKRPRSSMSPILVFDRRDGRLLMSLGSPGGSAIINYVGKVLLATLDWGLPLQEAIDLPNFGSRNGPTELEAGRVSPDLAAALEARGHEVVLRPQTSGLQGILRSAEGWSAGADPRREGVAVGE